MTIIGRAANYKPPCIYSFRRRDRLVMWSRLDDALNSAIIFLFYIYLSAIIMFEVFQRIVLNVSSPWAAETAVYAYIWMTYFACARGVKERTHLRVEILPGLVGRTGNFLIYLLSDICFFVLAAVIVVTSFRMVSGNFQFGHTFIGADLPLWIATMAVPIGWTLIAIRVIERSFKLVRAYFIGQPIRTNRAGQ